MLNVLLQFNTELFRVSGILVLIFYTLETLKEGYVSFFVNPVWFLALFVVSGLVWLFTPDYAISLRQGYGRQEASTGKPDKVEK